MSLSVESWLKVVTSEYVTRYVASGGSAVKVVIGNGARLEAVDVGIANAALQAGLITTRVDAALTRIHLIQNVFFAVAEGIDWEALAQRWMETRFSDNGYTWPRPGQRVPLSEVADANSLTEALLSRTINAWLSSGIARDPAMAQDFRNGMVQLCLGRLEPDDPMSSPPVIEWLRGTLRAIGPLRDVPIGARITRNNGRAMLRSLCRWLTLTGSAGLVVRLDLRHLTATAPGPNGEARYTPAAVLDTFEVLRQFIDDAELFDGLLLVCLGDDALVDGDPRRSILNYPALRYRLEADVYALRHDNRLAPLIRLGAGDAARLSNGHDMLYSEERVAIEALRAGVPNRTAIRRLTTHEPMLEAGFIDSLTAMHASATGQSAQHGFMVAGEFGAGKSHLLGHFAEVAKQRDFVVSKVTISKETPLFSPERVFVAAMRNAELPDHNDDVMRVVVQRLLDQPEDLAALETLVSAPSSGFSTIFAALLHVLPKRVLIEEDRAAIAGFFAGGKLGTPRIRSWLRTAGSIKLFDFQHVKAAEMAEQRLSFVPLLFRAAGYGGWCLLIDEIELVARYSTLQRGRSFAELSRWLGLDAAQARPGLVTVGAVTSDFSKIFNDRLDPEKIPALFEARDAPETARLATAAMEAIERQSHNLSRPDHRRLRKSIEEISWLYKASYDWSRESIDIGEARSSKQLRAYVKSWVTAWDIERLYGVADTIGDRPIVLDNSEEPDFEKPTDPGDEDA